MIEIVGYICAIFIGLSLGLIGGGGSILTVPVLTYLFGKSAKEATMYSLFIVGVAASFGAIKMLKKGLVDFKTGAVFSIPALASISFARAVLVPAIPKEIFSVGTFTLTDNIAIMILFAVVMLKASVSMIKGRGALEQKTCETEKNYSVIMVQGVFVGLLTGTIGAGGGFLIIPALVLLAKMPMKTAVGTSLMIIAVNSLLGFGVDVITNDTYQVDWKFLSVFASIAVVGIFVGSFLSNYISGEKLKKSFGWFVLVMGCFILVKELL